MGVMVVIGVMEWWSEAWVKNQVLHNSNTPLLVRAE